MAELPYWYRRNRFDETERTIPLTFGALMVPGADDQNYVGVKEKRMLRRWIKSCGLNPCNHNIPPRSVYQVVKDRALHMPLSGCGCFMMSQKSVSVLGKPIRASIDQGTPMVFDSAVSVWSSFHLLYGKCDRFFQFPKGVTFANLKQLIYHGAEKDFGNSDLSVVPIPCFHPCFSYLDHIPNAKHQPLTQQILVTNTRSFQEEYFGTNTMATFFEMYMSLAGSFARESFTRKEEPILSTEQVVEGMLDVLDATEHDCMGCHGWFGLWFKHAFPDPQKSSAFNHQFMEGLRATRSCIFFSMYGYNSAFYAAKLGHMMSHRMAPTFMALVCDICQTALGPTWNAFVVCVSGYNIKKDSDDKYLNQKVQTPIRRIIQYLVGLMKSDEVYGSIVLAAFLSLFTLPYVPFQKLEKETHGIDFLSPLEILISILNWTKWNKEEQTNILKCIGVNENTTYRQWMDRLSTEKYIFSLSEHIEQKKEETKRTDEKKPKKKEKDTEQPSIDELVEWIEQDGTLISSKRKKKKKKKKEKGHLYKPSLSEKEKEGNFLNQSEPRNEDHDHGDKFFEEEKEEEKEEIFSTFCKRIRSLDFRILQENWNGIWEHMSSFQQSIFRDRYNNMFKLKCELNCMNKKFRMWRSSQLAKQSIEKHVYNHVAYVLLKQWVSANRPIFPNHEFEINVLKSELDQLSSLRKKIKHELSKWEAWNLRVFLPRETMEVAKKRYKQSTVQRLNKFHQQILLRERTISAVLKDIPKKGFFTRYLEAMIQENCNSSVMNPLKKKKQSLFERTGGRPFALEKK